MSEEYQPQGNVVMSSLDSEWSVPIIPGKHKLFIFTNIYCNMCICHVFKVANVTARCHSCCVCACSKGHDMNA